MCLASASRKCFIHSLLTGRRERSADLLAAQLDANHALHLAQDQVVRDAAARLVVVHDLGLFADFLEEKVKILNLKVCNRLLLIGQVGYRHDLRWS